MLRPFRLAAIAALALAPALTLAACSSAPPPVVAPPPPPPPAPPAVSMSSKLIDMASAYRAYVTRTAGIQPSFADGPAVARSLQAGAAYDPDQMVRGQIAYAAIVALQDKAFVAGVRVYVKDREQRRQIAYEILKDPNYALGLTGAQGAANLAVAALGADAQGLYDAGKAVKQAAYDLQKEPWSRADVPERDARLGAAKAAGTGAMLGDVAETARLQQAATGGGGFTLSPAAAGPPYSPTIVRGLAIAALAALGEAGDDNMGQILALMSEPNTGRCMNMSKLNLYQCLAVARPHYEDMFCLGQHVMMDTGRCLIHATGLPEPYEPRFVPTAASIAKGYVTKKPPATRKRKKS